MIIFYSTFLWNAAHADTLSQPCRSAAAPEAASRVLRPCQRGRSTSGVDARRVDLERSASRLEGSLVSLFVLFEFLLENVNELITTQDTKSLSNVELGRG